ncbi:MAG: ribonuclease HII [Thermoanaerobaculia bacterium]
MATLGQLMVESYRLRLLGGLEGYLQASGFSRIAGVDEAGRGCLAGPVVAAAVIVDPSLPIPGVDDSKVVSPERRERLADLIRTTAVAWSVVEVAPAIIDRINILEATKRAMVEALDDLDPAPDCVLVDAVSLPTRQAPCLPLIRGDSFSYAIACASILAKVERDRGMRELDRDYPQYGFADNKGYGAEEHRRALAEFGPSPAHRLTFRSVLPRISEASR